MPELRREEVAERDTNNVKKGQAAKLPGTVALFALRV